MSITIVILLCLCGVFCFGPLSLYLTWLGSANRRNRPTVLAGSWDFVALVAGLSGFLLFGGGVVLAGLQSSVRSAYSGNWAAFHAAWESERIAWAIIVSVYVLLIVGFVAMGMASRARTLAVYNIDRDQLEPVVDAAIVETGLSATRVGNLWAQGAGVVEIDVVPGLRHATVKLLPTDDRLREELERHLRGKLSSTFCPANPVAVWITSAAMFSLFFALACVAVLWFFFFFAG